MAEKKKVSCPRCGATNYYPLDAVGKKVVCGRCKNVLPVPGMVLELPPESASVLVHHSSLPVLIDFYSPTCPPCLIMDPVLERMAKRRAGEIMVVKLNVDRHPELAASYGIQGVPTYVVIHKGTERGRTSGAMPEADFSLWVASRT
jgi:thioredoxin 2